jgi:hypothetical protein
VDGTDVTFAEVPPRVVRVDPDEVGGTFYGLSIASLAEIEVTARGEAIASDDTIFRDGFDTR